MNSDVRQPLRRLAAGMTATLIGWGVLVVLAVRAAANALEGQSSAWIALGIAAVAGSVCLFATLSMGLRAFDLIRATREDPAEYEGRRARR